MSVFENGLCRTSSNVCRLQLHVQSVLLSPTSDQPPAWENTLASIARKTCISSKHNTAIRHPSDGIDLILEQFWMRLLILLLFCLVSRRTRSRHRNGRAWCIEKHWLLLNTQHWNRIAVQPLGYHEEKTQIMSKIFSVALIIQIRDCITLFTLNWTVLYVEQLPARWSWTRESAQVFWLDEAPTSIVLLFCSLHMHWFDIRATNRSTNISIYSFYVWSQKYIVSVSITYTVELRRCLRNQELSHPSNKYQETNQTTNPHLNFIAQRCRVRLIRSGPLHRNID